MLGGDWTSAAPLLHLDMGGRVQAGVIVRKEPSKANFSIRR